MDQLDVFIRQTRVNIKQGYYSRPPNSLNSPTPASLRDSLSRSFTLIAEIKPRSPLGDYAVDTPDITETCRIFSGNGAGAISVIVEPKLFNGSLENVSIAKSTGLPVLFKDFVIDQCQIGAAAKLGADAILMIETVVNRLKINRDHFIQKAHDSGLEVLLECYHPDELETAASSEADIIGINNRDLRTLKVDVNKTPELLKLLPDLKKPVVSESGIQNKKQALLLKNSGVNGILVGTSLWKAPNMGERVRKLSLK